MKQILTTILFFILSVSLVIGQINRYGISELRPYKPDEYNARAENWSIAKDSRGIFYFAKNTEGVMEFDGTNWTMIPIDYGLSVNMLCTGEDGIVYTGGTGNIGKLVPNSTGKIEHKSFTNLIKDENVKSLFTGDIEKIYSHNGSIYFCSRQFIFIYNNDSISVIDFGEQKENDKNQTFLVNNRLFTGSAKKGLYEIIDNNAVIVNNSEVLINEYVHSIIQYDNENILIATRKATFFLFNLITNEFKPWHLHGKISYFLKNNEKRGSLHTAINLANGNFGFGFVAKEKCSFFEVDKTGNVLGLLNSEFWLYY
jgi:hypothetical protein